MLGFVNKMEARLEIGKYDVLKLMNRGVGFGRFGASN